MALLCFYFFSFFFCNLGMEKPTIYPSHGFTMLLLFFRFFLNLGMEKPTIYT
jgi:hypothetical protein